MRGAIAASLLALSALGCGSSPSRQAGIQGEPSTPVVIQTPEIVRILEREAVVFIATSHSQSIHIQLKDGSLYQGIYIPTQAGKHSQDPNLSDILNLVNHIKRRRSPDEVKEWKILCE